MDIERPRTSPWLRRKHRYEEHLPIGMLIFLIALTTLMVVLLKISAPDQHKVIRLRRTPQPIPDICTQNSELCQTKGCIKAAHNILEHLDMSVNPCDDFYHFSCGTYIRNGKIPEDKPLLTIFTLIGDKLDDQLRIVLEEPHKEGDPKAFKLAKEYYEDCKDEITGYSPLLELLQSLGGWPVLEQSSWKENDFTWLKALYTFRQHGIDTNYFIKFGVDIDPVNSTKRILTIDQPSFGLIRDFLVLGIEDKLVQAYSEFMVEVAIALGAPRLTALNEMNEVLDFEIKLAEHALSLEQRGNVEMLFHVKTIKEMQTAFPTIQWLEFINTLLAPVMKVDENEKVDVFVPDYVTAFERIIEQTPKRVQANYVLWRFIESSIPYSSKGLRKLQLKFEGKQTGVLDRQPRWKECISQTNDRFKHIVGSLYVRKFFGPDAKRDALQMVMNLLEEFRNILKNTSWMDPETRKNALEKSDAIVPIIGYSDELLDNQKLDDLYKELLNLSTDYITTTLRAQKHLTDIDYLRLRDPINATDWIEQIKPALVNAFYLQQENSIKFPAGILQGLLFDKDRPKYLNYGAIGSIIGHEITHAFDDKGNLFDKVGNFVNWWAPDTNKTFMDKAKCMIEQYGNYTVDETKQLLNGVITKSENIADNGGLKGAYWAYQRYVNTDGPEPQLPGLNYTPNQLFWISFAMNWCAVYRPESIGNLIATDTHSISKYRVNGPVSNFEDFSRDFNCPIGSKMNPVNKCSVW